MTMTSQVPPLAWHDHATYECYELKCELVPRIAWCDHVTYECCEWKCEFVPPTAWCDHVINVVTGKQHLPTWQSWRCYMNVVPLAIILLLRTQALSHRGKRLDT